MLILGRKKGQTIKIGENITINILNVVDGFVKLGFDAPRDIIIDREEVVIKRKLNPIYKKNEHEL